MKKLMKYIVLAILVLTIMCTSVMFNACSDGKKTIGIIQFVSHESLNNCYEGIILGLKEGLGDEFDSYNIVLHNSNADVSTSGAQASELVNKNVALISAIATPSAMAAANAAKGSIPVVYCAVSDPKVAGLDKMQNVTGSSDLLDFEGQLKLIKAFIPDVDKIGVLYTTTEENSHSQIKTLKEYASNHGIEIVEKSVTNANEIPSATDVLLATEGLDCITNLTDNTIVNELDQILTKANAKNIPIFGSEIEQVKKGCLASASLDYVALGKKTGLLMAKILKGELVASAENAIVIEDSFNCYSDKVAKKFGLTVPAGLQNVD